MARQENNLDMVMRLGISYEDASALRRASMTLRRWYEGECGGDSWAIERDEISGKPYRVYYGGQHPVRYPIPDRERGAEASIRAILSRYPGLTPYYQTDPRGCALYLIRPGDIPQGEDVSAYYTRGVAVY